MESTSQVGSIFSLHMCKQPAVVIKREYGEYDNFRCFKSAMVYHRVKQSRDHFARSFCETVNGLA
jgi:hypothetical protein